MTLEKTGWDTFILRNEAGLAKTSVRCSLCKQSWHEFHRTTKDRGKVYLDSGEVGVEHSKSCEKMQARLAQYIAYWGKAASAESTAYQLRIQYIKYNLFNWKDRGDGGHECSAKCQSATGPNCECKCQGKNHGGVN